MSSDEMLEYEENHKEELIDKFIEQNTEKWQEFVDSEFTSHEAGKGDMMHDQMKDDIMAEGEE